MGAYMTPVAHFIVTMHISGCLPTVYDIPHAQVNSRCVFTNTLPTAPYRGAGRPEAGYLIERVIDAAADATGIDAAELRRRNLIKPEQMPYTTAFGNTYDSGEFPAAFERALALADYAGFPARKKAAKKERKLRGIGIGCYLEIAGAFPEEAARISFPGGGKVLSASAPAAAGRAIRPCSPKWPRAGSASTPEAVTVTSGDSARDVPGFGAVASRSAMYVGGAIARTADAVIEKGKRVAAMLLQAGEAEVEYRDGKFSVKNREVSLFEVAERAAELKRQGVIPESLDTTEKFKGAGLVPQRLPRRRGRDRRRYRRARGQDLCGGRRLRQSARRHRSSPARSTAASRRGSARRSARTPSTTPAASSSPARSWTTPCRARTTCRR